MQTVKFSIIIPVAGIGKRMKSYGPKALIRLDEGNVLGRQLEILQSLYPESDIVIISGFEDLKIREFITNWKNNKNIKVVTNRHYQTTNVAKSIAQATEFCRQDNYLIVYGDLVFTSETFSEMEWVSSGVLLDKQNQLDRYEAGAVIKDSRIDKFCYDTEIKWAQIAFLLKEEMELFLELLDNPNRHRYFSFEIFNLMLEKTELKPYFNEKLKIVELDHSENIQKAKKLVRGEI